MSMSASGLQLLSSITVFWYLKGAMFELGRKFLARFHPAQLTACRRASECVRYAQIMIDLFDVAV